MTSSRLCLQCMSGYVRDGVCQRCGKPDRDENRNEDALPYGASVGQYRLGRVLGQGGFGITYHVWDTQAGRPAALKEFYPTGSVCRVQDGSLRVYPEKAEYFKHVKRRFQEEAHLIYSLRNYPEIFQVYNLFSAHGTAYYAMEYLEGINLATLLQQERRVSWERLEEPVWGALGCLRILHSHHLIHRDISPDNIFLQNSGISKLIDFGSVRNYRTADHFTGIFKGSLAPLEMYDEHAAQGPWTDTFSLCATVYYLLSGGILPTHVYDRLAARETKGKDSLVPLSTYAPQTPAHILQAVERGLALEPSQRLLNVDAFQHAFFPDRSFLPVTRPTGDFSLQNFRTDEQTTNHIRLCCTGGSLKGSTFDLPVGQVVALGRGIDGSHAISYPSHTKGVSRKQCAFYRDAQNRLYVMDTGSTYGTFLNGRKLQPNIWCQASIGQTVAFGWEEFHFLN